MNGRNASESHMGIVKFIAKDPNDPAATRKELEGLVSKARGVVDWTLRPNGEATLEYDPHQTNVEILEEALTRLGFQVKPIADEPDANESELRRALGHEPPHWQS
jgi:predicted TIM-barrel fold metal-dependent hydrolase